MNNIINSKSIIYNLIDNKVKCLSFDYKSIIYNLIDNKIKCLHFDYIRSLKGLNTLKQIYKTLFL